MWLMKGTGVCGWCGGSALNKRWGTPQKFCSQTCGKNAARLESREAYRAVELRGERRRQWFRKYGMSEETYQEWVDWQDGVCAICLSPPNGKLLAVDHDHDSGEVRGLLCSSCNMALGAFGDQTGLLLQAVAYLSKG